MKLTVSFDEHDVHKMLEDFFDKAGFRMTSAEDVVTQFITAFPGGLQVSVEPVPVIDVRSTETTSSTTHAVHAEVIPGEVFPTDDDDSVVEEDPHPVVPKAMSFTDLMDPSNPNEDISAINKLVDKSNELSRTKART